MDLIQSEQFGEVGEAAQPEEVVPFISGFDLAHKNSKGLQSLDFKNEM